jgi:nickel/cobalt exporter
MQDRHTRQSLAVEAMTRGRTMAAAMIGPGTIPAPPEGGMPSELRSSRPAPGLPVRRAAVRIAAVIVAIVLLLLLPAATLAHPLGNFTINHFAGIRIGTDRVALDVVIDRAEIPAFTERQRIDADGDGQVSDEETEIERQGACASLATSLSLAVDGTPVVLSVEAAGLSFPQGAGGLSTMRLVCEYGAHLSLPLTDAASVHFADESNAGRIGWREVVVTGDGVTISGPAPTTSVSERLTSYPQDLLSVPLATNEVTVSAAPGGQRLAAPCIRDAFSLTGPPTAETPGFGCEPQANGPGPAAALLPGQAPAGHPAANAAPAANGAPADAAPSTVAVAGAVPGGVGNEISSLLQTRDLTPPIVIVSLLTAMGLGAAHALTPGHGKTVMAAYLVGARGTARQAVALGLTVTIAHTVGVLLFAVVVLSVSRVAPEAFNHAAGIASGLLVLSIGGWLFLRQGLPLVRARSAAAADRDHGLGPPGHDHDEGRHHDDDHDRDAGHDRDDGRQHDHGDGAHSHGGVAHRHLPPAGDPLTWRSLFALGLFGGLVPSINALIILLATLATGRAAYGLVLVVAFGTGMALVLGGTGLGLVYASRWMARSPSRSPMGRISALAPAITSIVIIVVGVVVTGQAILGGQAL